MPVLNVPKCVLRFIHLSGLKDPVMRIILVHFNRNLMGLSNSVRNIAKSGKSDPNYARLTEKQVYSI